MTKLLALRILLSSLFFSFITLTIAQIPGDINNDGVVNSDDYLTLKNQIASNTTDPMVADLDNSGVVNIVDMDILSRHIFNGDPISGAGTNSTPIEISFDSQGNPFAIDLRYNIPSMQNVNIRAFQIRTSGSVLDFADSNPGSFDIFRALNDPPSLGDVTICGASQSIPGLFGSSGAIAFIFYLSINDPTCFSDLILIDENGDVYDNVTFTNGNCYSPGNTGGGMDGDVNGDGMVNSLDVSQLKNDYLQDQAGNLPMPISLDYDFNSNGAIELGDIDLLSRHVRYGEQLFRTHAINGNNVDISITNLTASVDEFVFDVNGSFDVEIFGPVSGISTMTIGLNLPAVYQDGGFFSVQFHPDFNANGSRIFVDALDGTLYCSFTPSGMGGSIDLMSNKVLQVSFGCLSCGVTDPFTVSASNAFIIDDFSGEEYNNFTYNSQNFTFGSSTTPGDINNDGTVNANDYTTLKSQIANNTFDFNAADINNDGTVNIIDVDMLSRHIFNGDPIDNTGMVSNNPEPIEIFFTAANVPGDPSLNTEISFNVPSGNQINIRAFQFTTCCSELLSEGPSQHDLDRFLAVDDLTGNVTACGASSFIPGIFGNNLIMATVEYINSNPGEPCISGLILLDENGAIYNNITFPNGTCINSSAQEGDLNGDFIVDFQDYNQLKDILIGFSSTSANTDFNSDGTTDIVDLNILWNHINLGDPLTGSPDNTAGTVSFSIDNLLDIGGGGIEITMTNTVPVNAFQIQVTGASFPFVTGGVTSNFEIVRNNDAAVTDVCGIAGFNGPIQPGTHQLLIVISDGSLPAQVCVDNVIAVTANSEKIANTTAGGCIDVIPGCTDPNAINYDPNANFPVNCEFPQFFVGVGNAAFDVSFTGQEGIFVNLFSNEDFKSLTLDVTSTDGSVTLLPFADGTFTKTKDNYTVTISGNQINLATENGNPLLANIQNGFPILLPFINVRRNSGNTLSFSGTYTTTADVVRTINNPSTTVFIAPPPVYGCTHPLASNYNSNAQINDGSCILPDPVDGPGVRISENNEDAHHSSVLDLTNESNKGLLIPRMTRSEMNQIIEPSQGLMVYVADGPYPGVHVYNNFIWINVSRVGTF